jgi:hypothetical protein
MMSFLDQDFNSLEQDPSDYSNNYESDFNVASRRLVLSHALNYLLTIKDKLQINEEAGQQGLQDQQLKQIK